MSEPRPPRQVGMAVVAALALLAMLVIGVGGSWFAARAWEADNVPPRLRADRWELTRDGGRARDLAERECGELPDGAWVDLPHGATRPVLLDASDEQLRCFDETVVPMFSIGGL